MAIDEILTVLVLIAANRDHLGRRHRLGQLLPRVKRCGHSWAFNSRRWSQSYRRELLLHLLLSGANCWIEIFVRVIYTWLLRRGWLLNIKGHHIVRTVWMMTIINRKSAWNFLYRLRLFTLLSYWRRLMLRAALMFLRAWWMMTMFLRLFLFLAHLWQYFHHFISLFTLALFFFFVFLTFRFFRFRQKLSKLYKHLRVNAIRRWIWTRWRWFLAGFRGRFRTIVTLTLIGVDVRFLTLAHTT